MVDVIDYMVGGCLVLAGGFFLLVIPLIVLSVGLQVMGYE